MQARMGRKVVGNKAIEVISVRLGKYPNGGLAWLHTERARAPWPLSMTITISRNEPTRWRLIDTLKAGDRIELPHDTQADVQLLFMDGWWHPRRVGVTFPAKDTCPACRTCASHDVTLPVLAGEWYFTWDLDRFVVRTCITCGTCWEQRGLGDA